MYDWLVLDWQRVWWEWNPTDPTTFSQVYHWFNILEGIAWNFLAALVLWRYAIHRHTVWEVAYGLAFLSFGLTDFREAWEQSTWLICAKGVHLVALFRLRSVIMQRFYLSHTLY